MPTMNWAFLCDYAFVGVAGKGYINGTFETLNVENLPAIQPQIFVIFEIAMAKDENCFITAVINSPTGRELANDNAICNAPAGGGKIIQPLRFYNTEFSETGTHRVEIFADGISVYSLPFTISIS